MNEKFEVSVIPADTVYEEIGGFDIGGLHLYLVRSAEGPAKWLEVGGFKFTPRRLEILYWRTVKKEKTKEVANRLKIEDSTVRSTMSSFIDSNSTEHERCNSLFLTYQATRLGLLDIDMIKVMEDIFAGGSNTLAER